MVVVGGCVSAYLLSEQESYSVVRTSENNCEEQRGCLRTRRGSSTSS